MKRTIHILMASALCLSLLTPAVDAAKKKKRSKPRSVELSYSEPAYGTAGVGVCFQGSSCLFYGPPVGKERFFSVEIEDELGQPVHASIIQDSNEDGNYLASDDLTVGICGRSEEPVEIEPGKPVSVWVWQGPGAAPPCPGVASSGSATATFSTKP